MTEKMLRRRIRAHYEQLSEFERGRIIGLKEAGWANRRIARPMGRSDAFLGLIFQQDNAREHTAHVAMNCLTACQTLSWPAISTDLFLIEHVWDMIGKRLHLPGNVDDLARQLEQIWQKENRRRPSGYFINLCHVVW
ncbi:transposable element Tcb1 transposase [Trichonephila clavipes]|uniref:Transposable element Tcb1 transposase n=1 Tax=Trichonephila clavipes TaxID=2585209 RepID=A0A8X6S7Y0_TRICX|nr:transposable element Tcb1 transposase [Trichonephila clavipes]